MRKASEILGMPVVAVASGQRIESVKDLILDYRSGQVLGLVLEEGGLFGRPRVLPFANIKAIGPDAVVIESAAQVLRSDDSGELRGAAERRTAVTGTTMMTTDGRRVGTVKDFYFDERTGLLDGYEVAARSADRHDDSASFVPASSAVSIGQDVAFVDIDAGGAAGWPQPELAPGEDHPLAQGPVDAPQSDDEGPFDSTALAQGGQEPDRECEGEVEWPDRETIEEARASMADRWEGLQQAAHEAHEPTREQLREADRRREDR